MTRRSRAAAAAVAAGALALTPSAAVAQPVSCGQVITQSTRVSNDLRNCPGHGLVIGADHVVLDLNGHTLDGAAASDVGVLLIGRVGATVRNGTVREFETGVFLGAEATRNTVRRLRLLRNRSNGIGHSVALANLLERNTLRANGIGISLQDSFRGTVVRRNLVTDNTGHGVVLGETSDALIAGNRVLRSGEDGIHVFSDSFDNVVRANTANANGDDGIEVEVDAYRITVARNTANRNGDLGIEAGTSVIGGGNRARGNGNPAQCLNVFCGWASVGAPSPPALLDSGG